MVALEKERFWAKERRAKEQREKEQREKEQRAKEQKSEEKKNKRAKERRAKERRAKKRRAKEQRAKEGKVNEWIPNRVGWFWVISKGRLFMVPLGVKWRNKIKKNWFWYKNKIRSTHLKVKFSKNSKGQIIFF